MDVIKRRLRIAQVYDWLERFCDRCGQDVDDVLNVKIHRSDVVRVRHHVWSITKDTLVLSYPSTAHLFGVDHTSIMHGVKKVDAVRKERFG